MDDVTRRGFVKSSAGAAAGIAALGVVGAAEAEAKPTHHHGHPIVAWIGDPRDGKITVMQGKREVTVRDHQLVQRIARAAK
jgi:anaerobic selenocysteine-containing dehydrogenase